MGTHRHSQGPESAANPFPGSTEATGRGARWPNSNLALLACDPSKLPPTPNWLLPSATTAAMPAARTQTQVPLTERGVWQSLRTAHHAPPTAARPEGPPCVPEKVGWVNLKSILLSFSYREKLSKNSPACQNC